MKKFLPLVLGGLIFLVLIGGVWWFVRNRNSGSVEVSPEGRIGKEAEAGQETESLSVSGKIEDLLTLGQALRCTWQDVENNTGVAYVKGDWAYTETMVNGVTSYTIAREGCSYLWQEGQSNGYKVCAEPGGEKEEDRETEMPQGFSVGNDTVGYTCVPQVINDNRFEVPAAIQFIDPAALMQINLPTGGN